MVFAVALAAIALGVGAAGCKSNQPGGIKAIDRYVAAVQAYNRGDRDRAVSNLVSATRANPDLIMATLLLGDLYRESGSYEDALKQYQRLVKMDSYGWENFYKLGVTYQFLQRLEEAAAAYLKALKLNPNDANTNMNLGLVYLFLGKPDDAVRYTERATLLDPHSAAAFSNFGVALDGRGEFARAEAAYRRSLDLDPTNATTLSNLGTNLIAQNKGAEAADIMARVVKMDDIPLHRKRYGDALAKAGRYDDAIKQYETALKEDPKYYLAMNEIGWAHLAQYRKDLQLDDAKREQALAMWKQSLAVNPDQPRIEAAIKEWSQKELFRK